jgi:murein DD-endopeptidase MepM/ murein hydrolase activator NlpD
MRRVGLTQSNNKNVARKVVITVAFLLISACSPLSNRLVNPAGSSAVYPLTDSIVTSSISPRSRASYSPSRQVTSRSLAPIEGYTDTETETVKAPYRKSSNAVVIVRPGDTLLGVARKQGVDPVDLAELNSLEAPYGLSVGDELVLPGAPGAKRIAAKRQLQARTKTARTAAPRNKKVRIVVVPSDKPKKKATKVAHLDRGTGLKKKVVKATPHELKKRAEKKPVRVARIEQPVVKKKSAVRRAITKKRESGKNQFRWPIRGRVISEFGKQANGTKNDGINLSVPTGAAIVAAESGTVVYSGNQLKGFGNLVLIRHKNGWSTAYAHVSKMLVKKGQTVRRGQVIAKSGQTGSVSRPQLHFEIRRGTTPYDPRKILAGTKVAQR